MSNIAGLYIHVPFCVSKCPYCDFFSVCALDKQKAYFRAIETELGYEWDCFDKFDTLYIGGGTPSCVSAYELEHLLKKVFSRFEFLLGVEITLEINPGDVTLDKLLLLRDMGVNRISLGVQSFNDKELQFLGRRHNVYQVYTAIECIRSVGFKQLNLDLMYALPGQTFDLFQFTLAQAIKFNPEHLSCYELTVSARTPFGRLQKRGGLHLPDENTSAELFFLTSEFLQSYGYEHYEVSNFSRDLASRSRHNQKYWQRVPYLGLGPSAHSFDGKRRWWNYHNLNAYVDACTLHTRPIQGWESITDEQKRLEVIALGLRTSEGVALECIYTNPHAREILDNLLCSQLVFIQGTRVCPTRRGLLVADGIAKLLS
jgi:oxygen-independent coproporphyrinogen-3 oxidase